MHAIMNLHVPISLLSAVRMEEASPSPTTFDRLPMLKKLDAQLWSPDPAGSTRYPALADDPWLHPNQRQRQGQSRE